MTRQLLRTCTALASLVLLLAAGTACSSEDSKTRAKLKANASEGNFLTLRKETKEVLANKDKFSEETVRLASELDAVAGRKLNNYFTSTISRMAFEDNTRDAMKRYEENVGLVPELEKDIALQKRLLRLNMKLRQVQRSRDIIERIRKLSPDEETIAELDQYESTMQEYEGKSSELRGIRGTIEAIQLRTGVDYLSARTAPTCSMTAQQENMTAEDKAAVEKYFQLLNDVTSLGDQLSNLTNQS